MTFKLEIEMDNAAFDEGGGELARILRHVAFLADGAKLAPAPDEHKLRDVNGNTVGSWSITDGAA